MSDSNPLETFTHLTRELSSRGVGYVCVTEDISGASTVPEHQRVTPALRSAFEGTLVVNSGYDAASGAAAVRSGAADLVAYAALFLANPDLPRRFRAGAPLNDPNPAPSIRGRSWTTSIIRFSTRWRHRQRRVDDEKQTGNRSSSGGPHAAQRTRNTTQLAAELMLSAGVVGGFASLGMRRAVSAAVARVGRARLRAVSISQEECNENR